MTRYRNIVLAAALGLSAAAVSCSVDSLQGGHSGAESGMPSSKIINVQNDPVPGSLVVRLEDPSQYDALVGRLSDSGIEVSPVFKGLSEVATKAGSAEYGLACWYELTFSESADLDSLAAQVALFDEVSRIQFNNRMKIASDGRSYPVTRAATKAVDFSTFNDPQLGNQWHYHNDGSSDIAPTAVRGADISVADAWRLETGRPDVIVAVLDLAVQYNHPDLQQNMWVNTREIPDNGIDDDGNGYVDDYYGYNFVNNSGTLDWLSAGNNGHGTHVAGTVAAVNNNGFGVCGVAGGDGSPNSGVRIMALQVFNGSASASVTSTANAIRYAADNGAAILQCSWGSQNDSYISDNGFAQANVEAEAVSYFINGGREHKGNCAAIPDGNIAIFASGNDSWSRATYPGALRDCISVTATAADNLPAYYTNYGPGCNVAAPGGEYFTGGLIDSESACVLSTMPTDPISYEEDGETYETPVNYGYMQGTSMACPHVSGVAALGLSYALDLGKTFTREEFTSMILTSVNDIDSRLVGSKETLVVSSTGTSSLGNLALTPYAGKMGTGIIDAWRLLMQIEGTPCLVAEVGRSQRINLDSIFGGGSEALTYDAQVTISDADYQALGLLTPPVIKGGSLLIQPEKSGSAKITISAIAGGDTLGGGNSMGGMRITKEVSVIARGISNGNGGWL